MDKKNKVINEVFIALFVAMICLPLLCFNHVDGKFSAIENKTLTSKPELYLEDGSINTSYISQFESYFNDNVGLKEEALAANILVKYKLFGVLDIPNWLLGEDDNFFYTTGGEDILTYTGQNAYQEETIASMAENLGYMNKYFEQQGCTTYNMFIPNKEAVYSELYNQDIYNAGTGHLDSLEKYILENTDMNVINVKDAMIARKDEQLYYKAYDASHWNMNGAFVGYQELMQEIQKDYPDIKVMDKEDFEVCETSFSGLMQYYTAIPALDNNFAFDDVVYEYNLKEGYHSVMDETPLNGKEIDPNLNFYHFKNETIDNSETLLIVGDSYMYCFLLPMLGESFEDVYFVRNTSPETIIELAQEIEPTMFVFEIAERVVYESYFSQMNGFKNYLAFEIDTEEYEALEQEPEIHIDVPMLEDGKLPIGEEAFIEILGWAFDSSNDIKPSMVIAAVDDKYFNAEFYYRDDLAQMGEKYGECGFRIVLPKELLEKVDDIVFYVITENNEIYDGYKVNVKK